MAKINVNDLNFFIIPPFTYEADNIKKKKLLISDYYYTYNKCTYNNVINI